MPRLRAALLATTLLALPLAAGAQPVTGDRDVLVLQQQRLGHRDVQRVAQFHLEVTLGGSP